MDRTRPDSGHGDRTQIEGDMGPTPISEQVARLIEAIGNDNVHGATFLARDAVKTIALAAREAATGSEFVATLHEVERLLIGAKPSMASIENTAGRFARMAERAGEGGNFDAMKDQVLDDMDRASELASGKAAEIIGRSATVLTCSYSSSVLRALESATKSAKNPTVLAMESLTVALSYGQRFIEDTSNLGINGKVVADADINDAITRADVVLIGADKFLPDGSVVNGQPSLRMAQAVRGNAPLYVVCESFKRSANQRVDHGYDLVPAKLITRVVTD